MTVVRLQNLAIAWIAIWTISPPLFASEFARLLVFFATVMWLGLEFMKPDGLAVKFTYPVLLTLIFILYTGSVEFIISGVDELIDNIQIWIMLFFLIIWQSRRNNLQSLVPIFWLVTAIYPIWLFITVYTITMVNNHAARIIVRSSEQALELTQQGVGGYGLVYGSLLFVPSLLRLASLPRALGGAALSGPLRRVPRLAYALVLLNLGLIVTLVLTAGYSIAVIALLAILLSVTFLKSFSLIRFLFAICIAIIALIAAAPMLEATLTALLPFVDNTNFAKKIDDILASMHSGEATGTAADRTERYLRSLNLFADNPLIGTLAFDDLGKHSAILDNYARWGFAFGTLFVYLVAFPPLRFMSRNRQDFGISLAMLAAVAVIFGMNNTFGSAGLMLYIMFPVSLHMRMTQQTLPRRAAAGAAHA